eukprot:CAMPEP_0119523752 /NCGR_PEP_ID=MMETSP1344-20130328/38750_1 /TAXON_ID=236787 /ORGANISM="Florenciella parvula, Strain CCMP2471" /LENGTH=101 /DNA_ID=CAMNT_0007562055 /DNA_START=119 /DNA_END=421 /DNA_ORIENTATION=+
MFSKIVLALALVAGANAKLYTEKKESQLYMWNAFKADFNKVYESADEEAMRFETFVRNLAIIDERNEKDSATHGITKFADLTTAEFKEHYTNYEPSKKNLR